MGEESQDLIFSVTSLTDYSSSDFNGFRPNPAAAAAFSWRSPRAGSLAEITDPDYEAQLQSVEAATLADYSSLTGQDRNSILVDYEHAHHYRGFLSALEYDAPVRERLPD